MLNLRLMAKQAERLVTNNSPLILTVIGVTGTLTTAYLTGKATFKAAEIIREQAHWAELHDLEYEVKDKAAAVWKLYIPAATAGLFTVSAIILANRISTRRAAVLASAYALSERAMDEYKKKVIEKLGAKKEQAVRDDIAQDRINRNPVDDSKVIVVGGKDVLFYEAYTDRYFTSDMETVRKAQNDINEQIINDHYASLDDFYERLKLPSTSASSDLGWNLDRMLAITFSAILTPDGRPCISVQYDYTPVPHYFRLS